MRVPRRSSWLLLSLLWLVPRTARPQAEDSFFFIQLADPQFGMYAQNADFAQETANYEFAIATANRLKPRFVIVCGDLINKPGDEEQIAEYLRISRKLDPSIRLYHLAGNHDVGNEPTPAANEAWHRRFGPDYYSFREGPIHGIVLNSSLIHSPQNAPEDYRKQEAWLLSELEKTKTSATRHIVVFLHHPFFLERGDEADQYFNIPLVRRRPLLDLFRRYGVRHIFAGHYHRNAQGRDGELEMVTTGPVGQPLGGARSGLRLVWLKDGALSHRYYEFGALPSKAQPQ